jgi:hypothetical protein
MSAKVKPDTKKRIFITLADGRAATEMRRTFDRPFDFC